MIRHLQDTNTALADFHQLPAKRRLDFIINHELPLKFVRELPTLDLLLIIREVGGESSLELVEMMHPNQIQELFDLEIWSHDAINPQAIAHYFSLLFEADVDTAVSQIHNLDIELIGLMFKMVATIYDSSLGEEPYDYSDLVSTSPDYRFVVCFSEDDNMGGFSRVMHTYLEQLYARDLSFALRLLESVRYEPQTSLEEESLRWRNNRLLDAGILPREERLLYFSPVSLADITKTTQSQNYHLQPESLLPVTVVKRNIGDNFPFLTAALDQSSETAKDNFWPSFMHATTNMHASLSGDFGDRDEIKNTADYIKFLVEVSVFQVCQGKISEAGRVLSHYPVPFLIRLGRTTLTNLRRRILLKARDLTAIFGDDYRHADSPLRESAQALSCGEPRFYEGLLSPQKLTVRYFKNLIELNATIAAMNELIFRANFIGHGLGITEGDLAKTLQLSHANIFLRSILNAHLKNPDLLAEVSNVEALLNDAERLRELEAYACHFTEAQSKRLAALGTHDESDISDRAMNFKTVVMTQLVQNWRLALG